MRAFATYLGRETRDRVTNVIQFFAILYSIVKVMFWFRFRGFRVVGRVLINQLRFTGVHAIGPVSVAALAIGALVMIEGATYLPSDYIIRVTTGVVVKEVVPLLTALILVARSGTAIAIELGNMKLNEELAAILKMGIPIEHYVILPRLLGMVLSFLALVVYADLAALIGGYYVARAAGVAPVAFTIDELLAGVQAGDLMLALAKVFLFGVIIAVTAVQYGLKVRRSVREIPIVTTTSVVRSMIACLILNTFISAYW